MQENQENDPPMDDYGIDHDRILEVCEKLIQKIHQTYVIEEKDMDANECEKISQTLCRVWELTQNILEIDDMIQSALGQMVDPEKDDEESSDNDKQE